MMKLCESCKSGSAIVFCRADSAFLCMSCDSNIHSANKLSSRHERVWMCEVCESAPASVTCKADAASLCVSCDRDIHSANPLARRHERLPVVPFYESAAAAVNNKPNMNFLVVPDIHFVNEEEEDVKTIQAADSWLFQNPTPNNAKLVVEAPPPDMMMKSGFGVDYLFSDVDSYLDLDYSAEIGGEKFQNDDGSTGSDSVVPVQQTNPIQNPSSYYNDYSYEFDFSELKHAYNFTQSVSHSVSSEVGVVPDSHCNSMTDDISNPFSSMITDRHHLLNHGVISSDGMIDIGNTGNGIENQVVVLTQLTGLDREARVLRYREKRKKRKFEKTIRYASRKAYAETRPRIKGRFAKRTETEIEADNQIDRMFYANSNPASGNMIDSSCYGIVPSF